MHRPPEWYFDTVRQPYQSSKNVGVVMIDLKQATDPHVERKSQGPGN
jgi:hypothetical protein